MRLLKVEKVKDIKQKLSNEFENIQKMKKVNLLESKGYYIAEDICSPSNVPEFNKSRVDGYAVKFKDCKIASESSPCILNLVGSLNIGEENKVKLGDNECMYIPTGGMIPLNADAMVMIEHSEKISDSMITINKSATLNQNITFVGDDVKQGSIILEKGTRINERVIGLLGSLGITEVNVYKKLKVYILSSGDELVSIDSEITMGQTRDINSVYCKNTLQSYNFEVVKTDLIKDDKDLYITTLKSALETYKPDIIITSGGSSKGDKDFTIDVFTELSDNVFCEGIAIKPGKPTILASNENTLFIGLPGHPVSSYLVLKSIILESYLTSMGNYARNVVLGNLKHNVANSQGREILMLCKIYMEDGKNIVEPIYYSSTNIGVLAYADGYFAIGANTEGFLENEVVEVVRFG